MPHTVSSSSVPADTAAMTNTTDWMSELGSLLENLEAVSDTPDVATPVINPQVDSKLVQVRLGIGSALYMAMRAKHAPTASHSLRVALTSSAWAVAKELPDELRDAIELAALLHDVGNIGIPDEIFLKPGPLDREEMQTVAKSKARSLEILRCACADSAVLEIVENVGAWYDGSKAGYEPKGEEIPFGARMLTLIEAFDSMTTDHVYRPAMNHERAARELFEHSGSQFDPTLVREFVELLAGQGPALRADSASRWLRTLDPTSANTFWKLCEVPPARTEPSANEMFQARLLNNMHDAVIFIDDALRVTQWNHGAERLTSVTKSTVMDRPWQPTLLNLRDEKGKRLQIEDCPIVSAIRSGTQSLRRLCIPGRGGEMVSLDTHSIPVVSDSGTTLGAVMILHDASSEATLEEQCQNLHEKATKDPLTQVANRAEFDRTHDAFVEKNKQEHVPCSLVMCDLDRFKSVNDTYGHQAGDEVIQSLATLLKNHSHPGDLVARYGGEEFVMLCAACDNATVTRRAEEIREALARISQPQMGGRSVTASFGVTEIQPGDTAETMLRRADRALLKAKADGRNMVVQLGSGGLEEQEEKKPKRSFWSRKPAKPMSVVTQVLTTPAPVGVVIEKLRGFVADHRAKVLRIEANRVELLVDDSSVHTRRQGDRTVAFQVDLAFNEESFERDSPHSDTAKTVSRTRIDVSIRPQKSRDRRRNDVTGRANDVLLSFQSYLMASVEEPQPKGVLNRAQSILTPWASDR